MTRIARGQRGFIEPMAEILDVEPHVGIGPLRLGAPRREAHFALPALPTALATEPGAPVAEAWHDFALQAFFDEEDRIEYLEVERGDELRPRLLGAFVLDLPCEDALAVLEGHALGEERPEGLVVPDLDLLLWRPREESAEHCFAAVGVGVPGYLERRYRP